MQAIQVDVWEWEGPGNATSVVVQVAVSEWMLRKADEIAWNAWNIGILSLRNH